MTITAEIQNFILNASDDEIRQINDLIIRRHRKKNAVAVATFGIGDEVSFDAKTRGIIRGKIIKVNTKTVKVRDSRTNMIWNVSGSVIKKVA